MVLVYSSSLIFSSGDFYFYSSCSLCINNKKFVFCCFLQLCGDTCPNPGPSCVKFPCSVCARSVTANQYGIECCRCENWIHASCENVSKDEYDALTVDPTIVWHCSSCSIVLNELPYANYSLSDSLALATPP